MKTYCFKSKSYLRKKYPAKKLIVYYKGWYYGFGSISEMNQWFKYRHLAKAGA